jgi:glycine hydroxymethyltransferase
MLEQIKRGDADAYSAMMKELDRQRNGLEMIPSENFTSLAVMEALGSTLTNKYSEGYPGKRYYGGTEFIDVIERLAIDRAKKLFGVPHANVQAYSGSPANLAVYFTVCNPGDTVMGLNLTDGGHLTHGWKTSLTGKVFKSIPYHVKADGYIDIEEARALAEKERPKLIWVGSTAYSREIPFKEFGEIADSVGAYLAADISHISGLVVGGMHKSPVDYAHIITTTTHKTLRGPRGAMIMVTDKGIAKNPELPQKVDQTIFPGMQGGPHDNTIGGIAIALLEASKPEFKNYAKSVVDNSRKLAEVLTKKGIRVVTGGTDNHLLLVDLTQFGKGTGVLVQDALEAAGITVNKNTIPNDPSSPFYPSGIRLGTPALTTRGMDEAAMEEVGSMISEVIIEVGSHELPSEKEARVAYISNFRKGAKTNPKIAEIRKRVATLCSRFMLYPELV